MKYVSSFIILIHGLIHFSGFARGFAYGNVVQLTKEISKLAGFLWLATAVLFITATILFLFKKEWWSVIAIVAVILSQVLIINVWQDAKAGTIANVIVLLVAVPAYGNLKFQRMVRHESKELLDATINSDRSIVTKEMIGVLPPVVQKWLIYSGIIGKEKSCFIRLKQAGEMRTRPEGKWMSFNAEQYFNVQQPAFVWNAKVKMLPGIYMNGRDKFQNGKGEMLITFLSWANIANERPETKINQSAMLRYLAETCWFPSAALNEYIKWTPVDSFSAKATMNFRNMSVSGIFQFDEGGKLIAFSADRYYGNGSHASLEKWTIETKAFKEFDGIRIPSECVVIWKLRTGNFNWLNLRITDWKFNNPALYQ